METMYERIKRLREQQGLSQHDLAVKAGYKDRSAINHIEKGERNITSSRITAIAAALGVSPSYLMDGDENENEKDTDKELKVALFGGDGKVTDEMWDEVKKFAQYIKSTHGNKED